MAKVDVDYVAPVKGCGTSDDFAAHIARGSLLPGLDYTCGIGTKVVASGDGVVSAISNVSNQTRGKNIIIRHGDGKESHYLHLSEILVKKGQRVKAGEKIALSGNTSAGNSTGPHLHFAFKHGAKFLDPAKVLKKERIEARQEKREAAVAAEATTVVEAPVVEAPKVETPPMPKPPVTE